MVLFSSSQLKVVGENMKALEVAEGKALEREEKFKEQVATINDHGNAMMVMIALMIIMTMVMVKKQLLRGGRFI